MRRVPLALSAGLALLAIALGVVLTRAPVTVAGSNGVNAKSNVANTRGDVTLCEKGGTIPKGTSGLRVSLSANVGPAVTVKALVGKTVIAEGSRPAGWGLAETVTVSVKPLRRTVHNVRICSVVGAAAEGFELKGSIVEHAVALRVEYLRLSPSSWLSIAPSVAEHMGLGRAPTGAWIAWLTLAGMLVVVGLTCRVVLRELQ
jgi:hypothetical protein